VVTSIQTTSDTLAGYKIPVVPVA